MKLNVKKTNFINRAIQIHGDIYDYSNSIYTKSHDYISIICKFHGEFKQLATNHLSGKGCYKCAEESKESKKLKIIDKFISDMNFTNISEYRFVDCKNKNPLPFDRYIPELNLCIEYDGEQHFISSPFWGGEEKLNQYIINDNIKTEYCKKNNINLLRIRYDEDVILKLKNFFNSI